MKEKVTFNWVKKAIFTAAVSIGMLTTNSFAQSLHIGVTGGPQLTNFSSDIGKYTGIMGFNGGLSADFRLANAFSIGLDALYSQNGAKREFTQELVLNDRTNFSTYKTTEKLTYLQFHLLPKFIIPLGSKPIIPYDKPGDQKMFISIFAGPYYAIRNGFSSSGTFSGYTKLNNDSVINTYSVKYTSASADAKKVAPDDLGITAGAGINFNLNGGAAILGFEGRYSRSLGSLDYKGYYGRQYLKDNKIYTEYANIANTAIAFNVSLKFRIIGD